MRIEQSSSLIISETTATCGYTQILVGVVMANNVLHSLGFGSLPDNLLI